MTDAAPTVDDFRATIGLFATGVAVVTAGTGDLAHGMTANAIASDSLDPLLVLVCVEREALMNKVIPEVGTFALSILAADQEHLSRWFADRRRLDGPSQFDGVPTRPGPATGAPLLDDAVAWIECAVDAVHPAGDHHIFIGKVVSLARSSRRTPLLYFASQYRRLASVDGEHPVPVTGPSAVEPPVEAPAAAPSSPNARPPEARLPEARSPRDAAAG